MIITNNFLKAPAETAVYPVVHLKICGTENTVPSSAGSGFVII